MTDQTKSTSAPQSSLAAVVMIGVKKKIASGIQAKLNGELDSLLRARLTSIGGLLQRLYIFAEAAAEDADESEDTVGELVRRYSTGVGSLIAGNCDRQIDMKEVDKRLWECLSPLAEVDLDGADPVIDHATVKLIRTAAIEGLTSGAKSPWPYPALPPTMSIKPEAKGLRLLKPTDIDGPAYQHMSGNRPIKDSLVNVEEFARYQKYKLWFDTFSQHAMIDLGEGGVELSDSVLQRLQREAHYTDFLVKLDTLSNGLHAVAREDQRHPVKEYWSALAWDGKERIATWLIDYCGVEDTDLHRAYARKFLIGAVRRVNHPGYPVRHVLVLEGPQHVGKSQALRALAINNNWFTDSVELGSDSKLTIEQTAGKLLIEVPELSGMTRRDVERVKADISKQSDRARPAYARTAVEVPRQFVTAATTNSKRYLKDLTGHTRFWSVRVCKTRANIDLAGLKAVVPQLWAEAIQAESTKEEIYLDDAQLQSDQAAAAAEREEIDPIMETWHDEFMNKEGDTIYTNDLWEAAGLTESSKRSVRQHQLMGIAAERAGWELKRRTLNGKRVWAYVRSIRH